MQTGNIGVKTENIFPVIKKFLYSDQEIFLREIISNAVDATQKLKALAASGEFKGELGDLTIKGRAQSSPVLSDSLRPQGLYSPRNSPGQNTRVGSLSLLQGIFPTQGSHPGNSCNII